MMPAFGPEIEALRDAFVVPFYMKLLHGNFSRASDAGLQKSLVDTASRVSDQQIERLLAEPEWRGRLCAAWFVGLRKRARFVEAIGERLLASETVYAGQGYCVALGLIANERCAEILRAYLARYLPLRGRFYDQEWAIGALAHVEGAPPQTFLGQSLWQEEGGRGLNPSEGIEDFGALVSYLRQHGMIDAAN